MGIPRVKALLWLVVALAPTVAAQTPDTVGQVPQRDLMDVARKVLGRGPDTAVAAPDSGAAGEREPPHLRPPAGRFRQPRHRPPPRALRQCHRSQSP